MTELLPVTQADRIAAADLHHWYHGQFTAAAEDAMRSGAYDDDDRVQSFATHRISTEQRIIAWLRSGKLPDHLYDPSPSCPEFIADEIENGAHQP